MNPWHHAVRSRSYWRLRSQEDDGLGILLPAPLPARPGTWRRNGTVMAWPRQTTPSSGATTAVGEQQPGNAESAADVQPLSSPVVAEPVQETAQAAQQVGAATDELPAAIQAGTAPVAADEQTAAQMAATQLPANAAAQEGQTTAVTPGAGSLDGGTTAGTTAAAELPQPTPPDAAAASAADSAADAAGPTAGQGDGVAAVVQSEPQQGAPAEAQPQPMVADTGAEEAGVQTAPEGGGAVTEVAALQGTQPAQEGGAAVTQTSGPQGVQPAPEGGGVIAETRDLQGAQPAPEGGAAVTETGVLPGTPGEVTMAAQLNAGPATTGDRTQPDAAAGESMPQQQTQTG